MKGFLRATTFLILITTGCAPNFCRRDEADCLQRIVGTYYGVVDTGGPQPTLTSFYLDANGRLRGKYFINFMQYYKKQKSNYYDGEIIDVEPLAEFVMQATWHDNSGKGNLRLVFPYDGHEFAGYFGFNEGINSPPWFGKKISNKATITGNDIADILSSVPTEETELRWPSRDK